MINFWKLSIFSAMKSLIVFWFIALNSDALQAAVGSVISVDGVASLQKPTGSKAINVGDEVDAGDSIRTEKKALVRLLLEDDSIVDIKENSLFKVNIGTKISKDGDRKGDLSVEFGSVRASINKKLGQGESVKIKTQAVNFSIRGTDFNIQAENGPEQGATLHVFEGSVSAEAPSAGGTSIVVPTRNELVYNRQGLTAPKALSQFEMDQFFLKSRISDPTVLQEIVVDEANNKRNVGLSSLRILNQSTGKPQFQIPNSAIRKPQAVGPAFNVISPQSLNVYDVTLTVGVL